MFDPGTQSIYCNTLHTANKYPSLILFHQPVELNIFKHTSFPEIVLILISSVPGLPSTSPDHSFQCLLSDAS